MFNPEHKEHLISEERKKMLPPEEIVKEAGVYEGAKAVDFGCGNGFLTVPLAERVGDKGVVYALDISKEMIDDLLKRLPDYLKPRVFAFILMDEKTPINDKSIDFFFLLNVLHEVEDKKKILDEAKRVLKSKGKIVVVEWKKEKTPKGPPLNERFSEEELKKLLEENGFKITVKKDFKYHFMMVGEIG